MYPTFFQKCTNKFFDCYLLEMNVVLHEEEVTGVNMEKVEATFEEYKERVSESTTAVSV